MAVGRAEGQSLTLRSSPKGAKEGQCSADSISLHRCPAVVKTSHGQPSFAPLRGSFGGLRACVRNAFPAFLHRLSGLGLVHLDDERLFPRTGGGLGRRTGRGVGRPAAERGGFAVDLPLPDPAPGMAAADQRLDQGQQNDQDDPPDQKIPRGEEIGRFGGHSNTSNGVRCFCNTGREAAQGGIVSSPPYSRGSRLWEGPPGRDPEVAPTAPPTA